MIENNYILLFKKFIIVTLIIFSALEAIIFPGWDNIFGCVVMIISWLMVNRFVLAKINFVNFFLPSSALLGYTFCYFYLPLVVTLFEGKPLTFNFEVPYTTFINQLINIVVLIIAYRIALHSVRTTGFVRKIWDKLGYFKVPSESTIWVIGFMGAFAILVGVFRQDNGSVYSAESSIGDQILSTLRTFAFFPYCLLFPRMMGRQEKFKTSKFIPFYIILISILGIATTRRAIVFDGIAAIIFLYLINLLVFKKRTKTKFSIKTVLIICLAIWASGPVADLATAMILNRKNITSGKNTFDDVMALYNDKEQLHTMYQFALMENGNGGNNTMGWDEYYVDNIFLDRFCNLRVQDETLDLAQRSGYGNKLMKDYFDQYVINNLPGFIVNLSGNKKSILYTPVDAMLKQRFSIYQYEGWKVGGDTGIGLATFGYWYYLFAIFLFVITFIFLGSCTKVSAGMLLVPLPILSTYGWYFRYFDNAMGFYRSITLLLASGWRQILLYCILMFFVKRVFNFKTYRS